MAWTSPSDLSTGTLVTAAAWNASLGASGNTAALRAGGIAIASQAVGDIVYGSSTTQLGRVSIGSANQLLTSSGSAPQWSSNIDVPGTLDVTGNATLDADLVVDTSALFVDASENAVVIGHTAIDGQGRALEVLGTTDDSTGAELMRFSANADGPSIALTKSRGGAIGTEAIVQDDDSIGSIEWYGDDGTDQASSAASIVAAVDGTPGSNDMPGRLMFSTTADGAASPSEHMRIAANGRLAINLGDYNNVYGNIEVEGIGDDIGVNMYPDDADAHQLINIAAGDVGDATRRGVFKLIATDDGSNAAIAMGSVGGVSCDFNFFNRRPTDGLGIVTLRLKGDSSAEFPGVLKVTTGLTSGTGSAVMVSQFNQVIDATDISNGYVIVTTTINRSAYQSIEGGIYDANTNVFHSGIEASDGYLTYMWGYTNSIRCGIGGDVQASDILKYVVWHVE